MEENYASANTSNGRGKILGIVKDNERIGLDPSLKDPAQSGPRRRQSDANNTSFSSSLRLHNCVGKRPDLRKVAIKHFNQDSFHS